MKTNSMIGVFVLLVVCLSPGCSSWREVTVRISEEQLQERLDTKFPITKTYDVLGTVTYSDPRIVLRRENNRVELTLDIGFSSIVINGENMRATVVMLASVAYDKDKRALF